MSVPDLQWQLWTENISDIHNYKMGKPSLSSFAHLQIHTYYEKNILKGNSQYVWIEEQLNYSLPTFDITIWVTEDFILLYLSLNPGFALVLYYIFGL